MYTPKQDSDVDCLHWHALNYRTAGLDAQGAWVELEAYFDKQIRVAYQAGRASRDAEVEALRADAARYQWLKENRAYHYSMQPDSPAEHGIEYQWQQGTYEERNQGLDGSIDAAIAIDAASAAQEDV